MNAVIFCLIDLSETRFDTPMGMTLSCCCHATVKMSRPASNLKDFGSSVQTTDVFCFPASCLRFGVFLSLSQVRCDVSGAEPDDAPHVFRVASRSQFLSILIALLQLCSASTLPLNGDSLCPIHASWKRAI